MTSKWARTPLGKVIGKIDVNTRAIAKLYSIMQYLRDDDTVTIAHQERVAKLLEPMFFALVQERRNLKLKFEEEFGRLQTRR
jgi:hypothetical protein